MSEHIAKLFAEVVNNRRSVRKFLPAAISQETLQAVFELAGRAPSNCNTQPWQVWVASGDVRNRLSARLLQSMIDGKVSMDFEYNGHYEGVYKQRQRDAASELYGALGIAREDKEKRSEQFLDNFRFFDAPYAAFVFLPEPFGLREAADVGMYAQTLMLSLTAYGLASCPQTALSLDADSVREVLNIPAENKLLFGISFGYEDKSDRANHCRVGRASLQQVVHFVTQ